MPTLTTSYQYLYAGLENGPVICTNSGYYSKLYLQAKVDSYNASDATIRVRASIRNNWLSWSSYNIKIALTGANTHVFINYGPSDCWYGPNRSSGSSSYIDVWSDEWTFNVSYGSFNIGLDLGKSNPSSPTGMGFTANIPNTSCTVNNPVSPPSYTSVGARATSETEALFTASINNGGGTITSWGWEISDDNDTWIGALLKSGATATRAEAYSLGPSGSTWYARGYATNSAGTTYSASKSFTMLYHYPDITYNITTTPSTAVFNVELTNRYDPPGTSITVTWAIYEDSAQNIFVDGGTCVLDVVGDTNTITVSRHIQPGTTYYYSVECASSNTTTYWDNGSFTTAQAVLPESQIDTVDHIKTDSVTIASTLIDAGSSPVIDARIEYSTDSTFASYSYVSGMNATISNLQPNTTYYVRLYVQNTEGGAYSDNTEQFTTLARPIILYTDKFVRKQMANDRAYYGHAYWAYYHSYLVDFQYDEAITDTNPKFIFDIYANSIYKFAVTMKKDANDDFYIVVTYDGTEYNAPVDYPYIRHVVEWNYDAVGDVAELIVDGNLVQDNITVSSGSTSGSMYIGNDAANPTSTTRGAVCSYFHIKVTQGTTVIYDIVPSSSSNHCLEDVNPGVQQQYYDFFVYEKVPDGFKMFRTYKSLRGSAYTEIDNSNLKTSILGEPF